MPEPPTVDLYMVHPLVRAYLYGEFLQRLRQREAPARRLTPEAINALVDRFIQRTISIDPA